ncbi:MAG: spore cortex biosynthesis protein YabQ [Clostridia bacterium]|nr:spore cortex biosynthesis protein YabQ [Clostridia bacterium]
MEISIVDQLIVSAMSLVLGIVFGAIYDIVRIWRTFLGIDYESKGVERLRRLKFPLIKNPLTKKEKQGKLAQGIVLFITDIIYFLAITIIMIIFVYYVNSGVVRWYIFIGAMLGLLIYYFTVGKIVISVSEYIKFGIKVVMSYLVYFILRPFAPIVNFLKTKIIKIREKISIRKETKKPKMELKNRKNVYKIGKNI